MGLFRFPHTWAALAGRSSALDPVVDLLDDRDRTLEDYLANIGRVYYDTGSDGGPLTTYSNLDTPAALSLPAGKWLIQGKGWFEFSTGTARTYQARIYDATGGVELDASTAATPATNGASPFALGVATTLTALSEVRIENKVSAVDGTQLTFARIWATPVTAIS